MKKAINRQRRKAFLDLLILIAIVDIAFFVLIAFGDKREQGYNIICTIFAVTNIIGLIIYKATSIIYDLIENEKIFITLFLLQEIRHKKVETTEDLTGLINITVEDLGRFSTAFYKIFNEK